MPRTLKLSLAGACAVVALVACQQTAAAPPQAAAPAAPDYAAEYGPLVDTFFEVWNDQDYAKLDGVAAADYIRRAPDQNADGLEAMKAFMQQVHVAYSDFEIVDNEAAYGDGFAFTQWTVTGTFTAEGAEPVPVAVDGATLLRIAGGTITEEHAYYDTAGLEAQTGTATPPHAAAE